MIAFLIPLLIALVVEVIALLLIPKPKAAKPAAAQDAEYPTASAGVPMIVVFGTMTAKAPNVLDYMDKSIATREVST